MSINYKLICSLLIQNFAPWNSYRYHRSKNFWIFIYWSHINSRTELNLYHNIIISTSFFKNISGISQSEFILSRRAHNSSNLVNYNFLNYLFINKILKHCRPCITDWIKVLRDGIEYNNKCKNFFIYYWYKSNELKFTNSHYKETYMISKLFYCIITRIISRDNKFRDNDFPQIQNPDTLPQHFTPTLNIFMNTKKKRI